MADHHFGQYGIVSGNLELPHTGAWTAEVFFSAASAPSKGSTADLQIGTINRKGTVVDIAADYLQVKARIVAGAGKLDTVLDARDYRGFQAAQIAQDALRDAGEQTGTWSALDIYCAHWTRSQGPCRESLRRVTRLLGRGEVVSADATSLTTWRFGDDGVADTVVDMFALSAGAFEQLSSWGQERVVFLGVYDSNIRPGESIVAWDAVRKLDRVLYEFGPTRFTLTGWYL
jgi:hypothetical protein